MKISLLAKKNLTVVALVSSLAGLAFSPAAQASPNATATTSTTNVDSGEAYSGSIPSTGVNLLSSATLDSSKTWNDFTSSYQSTPFVGDKSTSTSYGTLTDGSGVSYTSAGTGWESSVTTIAGGASNFTTLTYTPVASAAGYDITTIDVFTGWGDGGRINSTFNVLYSTDGTNFISLPGGNINFDGGSYGHDATFVQLAVTGLSGVTALQFQFANQQNGYVGYAELAALGSETTPVPEPAHWGILLGIAGGLFALKRIKRQA